MKIVLTGITATPYAREYLSNTATTLRRNGHKAFVTHEGAWHPPAQAFAENRFDFQATYRALKQADVLLALLDGYAIDDSVSTQIGIFYTLAREERSRKRRMLGVLHDTRVAGWDWTGGDKSLAPQVRQCILQFGKIYPNVQQAMDALEA